ncbi:sigma-70 family RNA polymerase sigma factor [Acinetobacter larvae]|uniref:RNA polymerase subunit sigma n=1 Tax=Acinetobacter larvae TaxID=1789224 RepID=A0A1B2LYL5_9GAMM|nr:sigma-70 family RNA polymerase sigma factor [Acinetobacter larvae]AOA58052.1 RNA polymerase subunit sigma [Acinetobacter larvae]
MADQARILESNTVIANQMYLQHHDWLQQWLQSKISYPLNAADIVQDTFVKILQTKQRLLGIQEPRAYLVNAAKYILIDQQRRYYVEKNYLESLKPVEDIDELSNSSVEQAIQILDFLTVALSSIQPASRQAFIMYYLEGYNQAEIAQHCNKSLRCIQNYLADCLSLCYEARQRLYNENSMLD